MADLMLIVTERKDKVMRDRVDMIGGLIEKAEQLVKAPIMDIEAIKAVADEMESIGLRQNARNLRKLIGE